MGMLEYRLSAANLDAHVVETLPFDIGRGELQFAVRVTPHAEHHEPEVGIARHYVGLAGIFRFCPVPPRWRMQT